MPLPKPLLVVGVTVLRMLAVVCRRTAMGSMKSQAVIVGEVVEGGVMGSSVVVAEAVEGSEVMEKVEGEGVAVSGVGAARWVSFAGVEAAIAEGDSEAARKDRLVARRKRLRVCPRGRPLIRTPDCDFSSSRLATDGKSFLPSSYYSVLAF